MKTFILAFILAAHINIINCFGASSVTTTESGNSSGEAYSNAMSKAPSGNYWRVVNVSNFKLGNKFYCRITWESVKSNVR